MRAVYRPAKIVGEYAYLPLGVDAKDGYAIVDTEHAWLDRHAWTKTGNGYAKACIGGKQSLLHWAVHGKSIAPWVIDHINQDKLDCRRSNLRHITIRGNNQNRRIPAKGVSFDRTRQCWYAYISVGNRTVSLGRHSTEKVALVARRAGEILYGYVG